MHKTPIIPFIATALLLFMLSACSPPVFPYGTYLSGDGTYVFQLNEDGTNSFAYAGSASIISEGTHIVEGNEITWETDSYCDELTTKKVTYTWTYEDDILKFHVDGADGCSSRRKVLNNKPFYPVP